MWLYILIFLSAVLLYSSFKGTGSQRNKGVLAVYLAGLALFVGLGDMLGGYDRYIYGDVFDTIADITDISANYWLSGIFDYFPGEKGYVLFNIIISFFTDNRYIFILIITLTIYSCLFISLNRYAENFPMAMIIFYGLWFFFTFTYLRQVLGATIIWLSIPYIIKRRLGKFLLVCFLASTIHKSAIIFIPVYFIANHVYSKELIKKTMFFILILGMTPIPNSLFTAYGDMSQVEMQSDYSASGGLRIAYILEAFVFLWLILRDYRPLANTVKQQVLLNIALLFCATLLFFVRSENGGRLSWYFMIGIICTISHIVIHKKNKTLSQIVIIGCFLLMMRIFTSWQLGLELYPYKTFLTDGYRDNDPIWAQYEYNHYYDYDKFCRKPFRIKFNFSGLGIENK